jgi:hypothetical protein
MEQPGPETSGDYGYDLAHEAVRGGRPRDERPHHEPGPVKHAEGRADQGQDLAYDEAHDF